jgi:tRNA(Arg) A34 adenosine deaminase TadA
MSDVGPEKLPMQIYRGGGVVEEALYETTPRDYAYMDLTLDEAEQAGEHGDNAVACTLVLPNGSVISAQTQEFRDNHLSRHAEEIAYDMVQPMVGRNLSGVRAYSPTEPCYGCAYRFDKGALGILFVAAAKTDAPEFFRNPDTLDHIWKTTRRELRVVWGLRRSRALDVLTRFPKKH